MITCLIYLLLSLPLAESSIVWKDQDPPQLTPAAMRLARRNDEKIKRLAQDEEKAGVQFKYAGRRKEGTRQYFNYEVYLIEIPWNPGNAKNVLLANVMFSDAEIVVDLWHSGRYLEFPKIPDILKKSCFAFRETSGTVSNLAPSYAILLKTCR